MRETKKVKFMREMILKKQKMEVDESVTILSSSEEGVLAFFDEDKILNERACSYIYEGESLRLFLKEEVTNEGKACFTVVKEDSIVPFEFTSYYRSVICFGEVFRTDEGHFFKIHYMTGKKAEELL